MHLPKRVSCVKCELSTSALLTCSTGFESKITKVKVNGGYEVA